MIKTICFLGDSITAAGIWESEIFEKARHDQMRFFNCGVSGGTATKALDRLYYMCLDRNPDIVSVMFGVNDVKCEYYKFKERIEGQLEAEKKEAEFKFELYKKSMWAICEKVVEAGAKLVLCTPVPFDNVTPGNKDIDLSEPLDRAVLYVKELAAEFRAQIVDFNSEMKKYMAEEQIFKADRIHPNEKGYRLLAEIWSKSMFDGKYTIDANKELFICDKLKKRREIERTLHHIRLVDYCLLGYLRDKKDANLAERIAQAEKNLEIAKCGDTARAQAEVEWYSTYIANINKLEKLEGEYTRLTIELSSPQCE